MNTDKHRFRNRQSVAVRGNSFRLIGIVWLVLLFFVAGCRQEEERILPQDRLTVEFAVDRETIHVGDPVELVITAYYPVNGVLKLPEIGRVNDVVLLKRDWENVAREDGLHQSEARYSITSFRLGEHRVSTNNIVCTVGEKTFTTNFPPVVLNVESSLSGKSTSELADIKPFQKLPGRIPRWIWVVLGSATTAFLVGLLTAKVWKNRGALIPSAPPVPPHIIALEALRSLMKKGLLEQEECKPFYTELSLILRTYLEGRFNLNAPDETTEEIVEELSRSPGLSGGQRNILQEFMRQADIVKFAKGHPDRATMESAFDTTRQFVEETKLVGETVAETGNRKSEIGSHS